MTTYHCRACGGTFERTPLPESEPHPPQYESCPNCGVNLFYSIPERIGSQRTDRRRTPIKPAVFLGILALSLGAWLVHRLLPSARQGGQAVITVGPEAYKSAASPPSKTRGELGPPSVEDRSPASTPPVVPRVQIKKFTVVPSEVRAGQSVTLAWEVANATEVQIDGVGKVAPVGTREFFPPGDVSEVSIHAQGGGTDNVAIERRALRILAPPVVNAFDCVPDPVAPGQPLTFHWSASGATRVSIDYPGLDSLRAQGEAKVLAKQTTAYTLTAEGPGGIDTRKCVNHVRCEPVTINVDAPITLADSGASACRARDFLSSLGDSYAQGYRFTLSSPGKIYAKLESRIPQQDFGIFGPGENHVGELGTDLFADMAAESYTLLVEHPGSVPGAYTLRVEFHQREEGFIPVGDRRRGALTPSEGSKRYRLWVPRRRRIVLRLLGNNARFALWLYDPLANRLSSAGTQILNAGFYDLIVRGYGRTGAYTLYTHEE